jgi:hypothetical protein
MTFLFAIQDRETTRSFPDIARWPDAMTITPNREYGHGVARVFRSLQKFPPARGEATCRRSYSKTLASELAPTLSAATASNAPRYFRELQRAAEADVVEPADVLDDGELEPLPGGPHAVCDWRAQRLRTPDALRSPQPA